MHLIKTTDAFREAAKSSLPFRRDSDLDQRFNQSVGAGFTREIEHRAPAEKDFILLQLLQVLLHFGFSQSSNLRQLRGC